MTDNAGLSEHLIISDPETLKVLADALRLQILRLLRRPRTVKQLGEALDTPPSKLYYHVNLLEKHNLIQVVETNIVSGIIEKVYQVTARRLSIDDALLLGDEPAKAHLEAVVTALFDSTREEVLQAVRLGALAERNKPGAGFNHDMMVRGNARLTPEQVSDFYAELEGLVARFEALSHENQGRDDLVEHGLLQVFYPLPMSSEHDAD